MKKAIVLLSGGLDSATVLYLARKKGFETHCLIFDYGQRHRKEIEQGKRIARKVKCPYRVLRITFPWQGSSLLDKRKSLPRSGRFRDNAIPSTYVPGRNIIFLSFAASYAETLRAGAIFIGANAIDYSGYPDCRPEFFKSYRNMLAKGMKTGVKGRSIKIHAPLIRKTKAQIIKLGMALNVPYEMTWSCYKGGRKPCKECDSCRLREKGFQSANIKDPL